MKPPRVPLFLARQTYRRRRIEDAARLLPFVGIVLLVLPLLVGGDAGAARGAYVFFVWFGLIVCAAVLSRWLRSIEETTLDGGTVSGATRDRTSTDPTDNANGPAAAERGRDA